MKKKKILSLLVLPLLTLSSCGFRGEYPFIKNGDALYVESNSVYDYMREVTELDTIDRLIEGDETFMFYVSSSSCSACSSFNEIYIKFIQNYFHEVYYIDTTAYPEVYISICESYPSYFLMNIGVPHLYLVNGSTTRFSLSNNYFETYTMFSNYILGYYYETTIYNFQIFDNLNTFIEENDSLFVLYYEKSNITFGNYFNSNLIDTLSDTSKNIAIADIDAMNEEDQNVAKTFLGINNEEFGLAYIENGEIVDKVYLIEQENNDYSSLVELFNNYK